MTQPGYSCASCPDVQRDHRSCPKPRKNGHVPTDLGAPHCKTLTVPDWAFELNARLSKQKFWPAYDKGDHFVMGDLLVSMESLLDESHRHWAEVERKKQETAKR